MASGREGRRSKDTDSSRALPQVSLDPPFLDRVTLENSNEESQNLNYLYVGGRRT